ncbi:MAG: DUF2384 domain-containing protein [Cyclobacteriaceae bacterium]
MKKEKKHLSEKKEENILEEPLMIYGAMNLYQLASRSITKSYVKKILALSKLSLSELMDIIPISIDTYKRKTEFGSSVTEKVLEVEEVYKVGLEAFGDSFYDWMSTNNVFLGDIEPKSMLKNSFGVRRLLDEIGRIEHGVLA